MPRPREHHGHSAFIGRGDDFRVTYRTTGLNRCRGPGRSCGDQAVRKRKHCLARHDRSAQIEPRFAGFPHRNARTVHPRHLSGTDPEGLFAAAVDDRVGLHVLADFPAKEHRGPFLGSRLAFRHDLEFLYVAERAVSILHEHTADYRPHFLQRVGSNATLGNHQPQVFFLRENCHGLVAEARRDDHLREDLGNGLRQISVERLIDDDDPTKRCLPISGVGLLPRRHERVCARDAARVRMLQDGHRRSLKLTDQVSG